MKKTEMKYTEKERMTDLEKRIMLFLLCRDIAMDWSLIYDVRKRYCLALSLAYELGLKDWLKCLLDYKVEERMEGKHFKEFYENKGYASFMYGFKTYTPMSSEFTSIFNEYLTRRKDSLEYITVEKHSSQHGADLPEEEFELDDEETVPWDDEEAF